MPLYRDLWRGYEMVYQPLNGHLIPTHRLATSGTFATVPTPMCRTLIDTTVISIDGTTFR